MLNIRIEKTTAPKAKPADESKLGFGKIFSDHMAIVDWNKEEGWHDARIVPFGYLSIHPASTCLHYGSEIFEGLKAYRTADNKIQMFRPMENAKRMMNSSERLCLPQLPVEDFIQLIEELVKVDADWVPHAEGTSLYIRPFLLGNDETLGVHAVHNATFIIITGPVGAYYAEGINPVSIMIEDEDVRAVRGGTGYAKCGGNYAASNRAGERAAQKGYSQVLWLDGVERKYIEEVGAMNVMFKIAGEIVTPELSGSILPGVTRKSCIELLKKKGYNVSERQLSIDELEAAMDNGTLEEAWGCGTAAVISPIGKLAYKDKVISINNGEIGEVTHMLYDTLTGIQWGKVADEFGWITPVC
ncbi:MAG: branched-chain amino acid aminotransferase [Clostridia bacterium]|nr:branched-chain amino acid aminotransferase [Clostridia bacterium]